MYKFGWCLTPETLTTRTNDPLAPQRLVFLRKVHRSSGQVPMDRSCKSCGVLASTNSKNGNRVSICIQQEQSIDFFFEYHMLPGTAWNLGSQINQINQKSRRVSSESPAYTQKTRLGAKEITIFSRFLNKESQLPAT